MSAVEHDAGSESGGELGALKRLMSKKIGGVPVPLIMLLVAGVGLFVYMRRAKQDATASGSASSSATDPTIDPSTGLPYVDEGVADPGGVSGIDGSVAGSGGPGSSYDPTSPGVAAGVANGPTSDDIEGLTQAIEGIQFPSGNPVTASPAPSSTSKMKGAASKKAAKPAPSKTAGRPTARGGQARAVRPPTHTAKPKATPAPAKPKPTKPAAHKPATPKHTPSTRR
jgi:hypothetical protein